MHIVSEKMSGNWSMTFDLSDLSDPSDLDIKHGQPKITRVLCFSQDEMCTMFEFDRTCRFAEDFWKLFIDLGPQWPFWPNDLDIQHSCLKIYSFLCLNSAVMCRKGEDDRPDRFEEHFPNLISHLRPVTWDGSDLEMCDGFRLERILSPPQTWVIPTPL